MSKNFIAFNGQFPEIDYLTFEKAFKETLKCKTASLYLFNQFPAVVTADSNVDLLLILAIPDLKGNYHALQKHGKTVYVHNLIMPIKFVDSYDTANISIDEDELLANEEPLNFKNEIEALKFGVRDYLFYKMGMPKNELYIHPLVIVKNSSLIGVLDNVFIGPQFNFDALSTYLLKSTYLRFSSYKAWSEPAIFSTIDEQIKALVEQAGKDSEIGYLTKKKIDRIARELQEERTVFEDLNKHLISIEGKAGTGKSSELLLLMQRNIETGNNTLYLTYNKLLVFDIARSVMSYINLKPRSKDHKRGTHTVTTLHKFFYHLSKRLGVLHVMSAARISSLKDILKERVNRSYAFIRSEIRSRSLKEFDQSSVLLIKELIQNTTELTVAEKEVGIDLLNYITKRRRLEIADLKLNAIDFAGYKSKLLEKIAIDDIFLRDYYEVLKNTLLAINSPKGYYEKFEIDDKFDLLMAELDLKDRHKSEDEDEKIIMNQDEFLKTLGKKVRGVRMRRTVYLDEAQDCHYHEREILFSVFGYRNMVIANGGREQLIRHSELCNWAIFKNKKLTIRPTKPRSTAKQPMDAILSGSLFPIEVSTAGTSDIPLGDVDYDMVVYKNSNRSYRIKKALLDFCNYVADQCGLSLGLTAVPSEDVGELIFDFRGTKKKDFLATEFAHLNRNGLLHGCTSYESMMLLIDADSRIAREGEQPNSPDRTEATINEFDNIGDTIAVQRKEWEFKKVLESELMFWDGATGDKGNLPVPSPNECRLLFYESCRGLEAWTVACFNIDNFFDQKRDDPQAEKFLLNEERKSGMQDLHITNADRKRMYAATWVLMALTRPINTLYLSFKNVNSEFSRLAEEYSKTQPQNLRIFR